MRKVITFVGAIAGLVIGGLTAIPASAAPECNIAEFTGNWCAVHPGQVFCMSIAGIEAADDDMNDSQLKSLTCSRFSRTGSDLDVKPLASIDGGRYSKVRIDLQDRVVTVWVKNKSY
jgi:hypothetical protein